mgnify:CR=1 FL=1
MSDNLPETVPGVDIDLAPALPVRPHGLQTHLDRVEGMAYHQGGQAPHPARQKVSTRVLSLHVLTLKLLHRACLLK